jgi:hypothetical protein
MTKPFESEKEPTTIRRMKTYKASQAPGFFDVELRIQWLLAALGRFGSEFDYFQRGGCRISKGLCRIETRNGV